jgi:hypothetical protein
VVAAVCRLDYSKPGKPDIDWDDPAAKQALVCGLVNDALAVLAELTGPGQPERDQAAGDALGLLALVAGQDVEPAEGSDGTDGRWVIARRVAPDRVISTVDQKARHTRKSRSNRKDGYRGHLASEPDTGLITDCEMTMATGEDNTDAAVGVKMVDRDRFAPAGRGGLSRGRPDRGGLSRGRPSRRGVGRGYRPCRHRGHCRDGGRCSRRLCGWRLRGWRSGGVRRLGLRQRRGPCRLPRRRA